MHNPCIAAKTHVHAHTQNGEVQTNYPLKKKPKQTMKYCCCCIFWCIISIIFVLKKFKYTRTLMFFMKYSCFLWNNHPYLFWWSFNANFFFKPTLILRHSPAVLKWGRGKWHRTLSVPRLICKDVSTAARPILICNSTSISFDKARCSNSTCRWDCNIRDVKSCISFA